MGVRPPTPNTRILENLYDFEGKKKKNVHNRPNEHIP